MLDLAQSGSLGVVAATRRGNGSEGLEMRFVPFPPRKAGTGTGEPLVEEAVSVT